MYGLASELRVVARGRGSGEELLARYEEAYNAGAKAAVWEPEYPVGREVLRFGREWRRQAERFRVLTFVAERLDVALAIEADGVLVEHGFPVDLARKVVGRNSLVLTRLQQAEDARQAARQGADALLIGPLFVESVGSGDLSLVARVVSIPCLGFGGIGAEEAKWVVEAGGQGVVVEVDRGSVEEVARRVADVAKAVMEAV